MNWCIIGAGGIADRRTIPAILQDETNKIVAVMDRVEDTAKKIGEKYSVPFFTSEDDMLSSVDCDAVYIGTPVACHYHQAMLSLKYGKHVFVEKPVSLTAKESRALVDAFKTAGKQITIGYMMKYHNLHRKVKEIIAQGGVGQVNNVRAQFSCWYPDIPNAWRQKKALGGGGAVMDLGVHCIELIEYILDDVIVDVNGFCSTLTFNYEVEDSAVIIFKTAKGTLGHIDVNFNIPDKASESKLEIYGTKGYAICKGTMGQEETGVLSHLYVAQGDYSAEQNRSTDLPVEYASEGGNLYLKQIQDFCNIINSGKTDYFYADKAVHVQELVDEIYSKQ